MLDATVRRRLAAMSSQGEPQRGFILSVSEGEALMVLADAGMDPAAPVAVIMDRSAGTVTVTQASRTVCLAEADTATLDVLKGASSVAVLERSDPPKLHAARRRTAGRSPAS